MHLVYLQGEDILWKVEIKEPNSYVSSIPDIQGQHLLPREAAEVLTKLRQAEVVSFLILSPSSC